MEASSVAPLLNNVAMKAQARGLRWKQTQGNRRKHTVPTSIASA